MLPLLSITLQPAIAASLCVLAAPVMFVGQLHSLAAYRANTLFVLTNERVAVHVDGRNPICAILGQSQELRDIEQPRLEQRTRADDIIWLGARSQPSRLWFDTLRFPGWPGRSQSSAFFLVAEGSEDVLQAVTAAIGNADPPH